MRLRRIDHMSFTVGDLDRSTAFYEMLGFEAGTRYVSAGPEVDVAVEADHADMEIQLLRHPDGPPTLELIRYLNYPAARAPRSYVVGAAHVGFCIEDVHAAYRELSGRGVEFISPPHTDEFGSNWVYFRDPDGNTVELMEDP